ncbi:zinc finger protein BRUTUS-like At1g18910 [Brassica napus]|uniref:zinc finger protein BRUTUS-like At1g18910 n=1 Tax=Brassica napus TaxID=3708 RepID=UPI0006AAEB8E|nr:zinc finger protein BRUTUS-like At1g18910 [Brassica napus]
MGVGVPLPPDKNRRENKPPDITSSSSGVSVVNARLSDSPILLFVYFHKAFRAQLAELHRLAGDRVKTGSYLAVELRRKFDYLKLVYKYHSAAEDEVIFSALDTRVKNIAFNYSLEHDSTEDLFTSIFHWLHVLEEERGDTADVLREVILCIGTIQSSICHHMLKEERQVFPLLIENFSSEEQASLVWQFMCSVPVMVLEEIFPWMTSLLSPMERSEVENCVKQVVPKELSLQLVINSWLIDDDSQSSSFAALTKIMKEVHSENMNNSSHQADSSNGLFQRFWQWSKTSFSSPNAEHTLLHGIQLLHNAIKRDLLDIQKGLSQLKFPSLSLDLNVLVVRVNFLADVLIFYGNAFTKFFYPVFEEMVGQHSSASKQFTIDGHVENFKRWLHLETRTGSEDFVITLQDKLKSLILTVSKQFSLEEAEVFSIISKNCNIDMQRQLLYMSLHVLPLGLLKCVIMWFSAQLSEDESQSIIHFLSWEDSFPNKLFSHLLLQWFRFGYSGKTSVESFWDELSFMFKPRCPSEEEHTEEASGSIYNGSDPSLLGNKHKSSTWFQPMDLPPGYMNETPYSSAMNHQMLIPGNLKPLQQLPGDNIGDHLTMDWKPIDLLFLFHKAMQKDIDYLVRGSARLASDSSFLGEFHQRFHLIKFLYQIHSDAEDEIAFPALEAKGKLQNISQSYSIDHELELGRLNKVSFLLNEMAELNMLLLSINSNAVEKYENLCLSLQDVCKSIHKLLSEHLHREETELWSLFRNCFTIEEQEKIIASMLGRMSGEILQDIIPWLMESLVPEEQQAVMSLWRQATRKTMFAEWLKEWYNSNVVGEEIGETKTVPSEDSDPLDIVWKYLFEEAADEERGSTCSKPMEVLETSLKDSMSKPLVKVSPDNKEGVGNKEEIHKENSESKKVCTRVDEKMYKEETQAYQMPRTSSQSDQANKYECLLSMSQEDVEATVRRISRDSSLDPQKKSYIMQNFLMSRWIATQRIHNLEPSSISNNMEVVPGQHPSYRDPQKGIFGCKHYKRNCKLLAPCCNKLFTCIRCHDEEVDHSVDRKQITTMMCVKCMIIQPIGARCSNISCNSSMGKYYCKICKLFDDEREIYHCPYCNLCRLGKGLGIEYFHCMKCNACMSRTLVEHVCREKCLEDNCPICHEYIFTSNSPAKALPCGHVMHSACFQEYTCSHYTCPICSKSLGDMKVYFRMLDALLAEQKMPDEYLNQTQVILCNDCGRKGNAPYHWLYHKCSCCASYNTRLL